LVQSLSPSDHVETSPRTTWATKPRSLGAVNSPKLVALGGAWCERQTIA
jgi:hypothetical protein